MNYVFKFFPKSFIVAFVFLGTTVLLGEEWKKEVLNCGDQVCFVLNGANESILVGSLMWANEAVKDGKEMLYERYFYEGISLTNETGVEQHIYGPVLEQTGQEWADTMKTLSFNEYVQEKQELDVEFATKMSKENVRYFNDEEREQTQVHWVDGALWQIGLDSEKTEISQVPEGVYAFVLGNEQLYITPKIITKKGKIQHSSFLRGGPVRSAGKLQVGADGNIVWLSNDSGHYRPEDAEMAGVLNFVKEQAPENIFSRIWVRTKSSEAWIPNPPLVRDYELSQIDPEYDEPVFEWLQKISM
ncbi:MAG: hypothetical protein H0T62_05930 [Parachlamydiaceae bacterium]|nr:hypothetical protein [Parachlamydiaceae bacterium]